MATRYPGHADGAAGHSAAGAAGCASAGERDAASAPRPWRGRRRAAVAVACALALGGVQAAGASYYSTHFVPGTTVNGVDVSGLTEEELARDASRRASGWKASVSRDDFSLELDAEDIGLEVDADAYARRARSKVDGSAWLLDMAIPRHISTVESVSYDEERLAGAVSKAVGEYDAGAEAPTDASCSYDEGSGRFEIVDERAGTALDADAVTKAVAAGVSALETSIELDDSTLLQPEVSADDESLVEARDRLNRMVGCEIPLTKDGEEVARLDGATVAGWLSLSDDLSVVVDQAAVAKWAGDALAGDVAKSDETHDYAIDADGLASTIAGQLQEGDSGAIEVPLTVTATRPAETPGARSRGRHVDINLSTQYARLYDSDGSVLWRSYIVSGNTSEGRGTPTGTYSINAKRTNETLVGADEDGDGEPDYESHVTYWMPFIGNAVGLHDASWRSSFGGSIYSYAGSHGCVNLPSAKAEELYSLVRVGDAVYVHY